MHANTAVACPPPPPRARSYLSAAPPAASAGCEGVPGEWVEAQLRLNAGNEQMATNWLLNVQTVLSGSVQPGAEAKWNATWNAAVAVQKKPCLDVTNTVAVASERCCLLLPSLRRCIAAAPPPLPPLLVSAAWLLWALRLAKSACLGKGTAPHRVPAITR